MECGGYNKLWSGVWPGGHPCSLHEGWPISRLDKGVCSRTFHIEFITKYITIVTYMDYAHGVLLIKMSSTSNMWGIKLILYSRVIAKIGVEYNPYSTGVHKWHTFFKLPITLKKCLWNKFEKLGNFLFFLKVYIHITFFMKKINF